MDIPIPEPNRSVLVAFLRILERASARSAVLAAAFAIAALTGMPSRAQAATVSGILVQYEGAPDPNRDLHFENVITHDISIAPTILKSPAPSTAFTYTEDTTVLPPTAQAVPKRPSAITGSASQAEKSPGSANAAQTATGNEPASPGLFPPGPPPSAPSNLYYEPPLIPRKPQP